MSIHHHPGEEVLAAYAAGTLTEAPSVLVATHLALCPSCRAVVAGYEEVGGTLLEETAPASMSSDALSRALDALDEQPRETAAPKSQSQPRPAEEAAPLLPQPLRGYLGNGLEAKGWRSFGRGFRQRELLRDRSGFVVHLLDIAPDTAMPHHGHAGEELTMVLQGGFSDETGHYLRGDVAAMDEHGEHRPVADPGENCICVTVSNAPVRLTGFLGRLLQPFLKL